MTDHLDETFARLKAALKDGGTEAVPEGALIAIDAVQIVARDINRAANALETLVGKTGDLGGVMQAVKALETQAGLVALTGVMREGDLTAEERNTIKALRAGEVKVVLADFNGAQ